MRSLEQIQKDIQELPEEAQILLVDFIEVLKRRYPTSSQLEINSPKSPYETFKESGFIGCVSDEEHLSITYKQVLADVWNAKYDHRFWRSRHS